MIHREGGGKDHVQTVLAVAVRIHLPFVKHERGSFKPRVHWTLLKFICQEEEGVEKEDNEK